MQEMLLPGIGEYVILGFLKLGRHGDLRRFGLWSPFSLPTICIVLNGDATRLRRICESLGRLRGSNHSGTL